jgi:hypothetical protein
MAGARRGIATAAARMRRLPRGFATLVVLAFSLLVVAGAQGKTDRAAQTEVTLEVLVAPGPGGSFGAVDVTPPDLDGNHSCGNSATICPFRYSAPTKLKLTALQTDPAYRFHDWTAAECPRRENVCELDLTGDKPSVAVFALYSPARIQLVVAGPGKLKWPGGECRYPDFCTTLPLPAGEPVVFTAEPTDPSHSIDWAYGCEPVPDNARQCVAHPENRLLGVGFNGAQPAKPFDVSVLVQVSKSGSGSGRIAGPDGFNCGSGDDCRKRLAFGKLVTLQADAAAGSQFDRWVGVCASNPACRFNAGPVTSVQARFVQAPPEPQPPQPQPPEPQPPEPQPPQPQPPQPQPPKLGVRITKLAASRRAGRWRVTARIAANKPVRARARVGRLRRTWGDRTVNLRAGTSSLTVQLARRARRGRCWFVLVARTAGGEVRTLPRRTVTLGR